MDTRKTTISTVPFTGELTGEISRTPGQMRRRSGSFSAHLEARQGGIGKVGMMDIEYSGSKRTLTVTSIENLKPGQVSGVGTALMLRAEHVGRQMNATHLETTLTAPSAHGFYRKMGLAPAPELLEQFKSAYASFSQEKIESMIPVWRKKL